MKVVVLEDDPIFRKELVRVLADLPNIEVIGSYETGEGLLSQVQRMEPDILFLDIILPGISGIQVAEHVRQEFPYLDIVFITADNSYMKDAIQVYATDYIGKPIDIERIRQTVRRISKSPISEPKIELKCEDGLQVLNQKDIYMVEAQFKKTVVSTRNRTFICLHTLKELEKRLEKDIFMRTSRSYLVNVRLVESIALSTRKLHRIIFRDKDYKAYLQKDLYPEFRQRIKELNQPKDEKSEPKIT